VCLGGIAPTAVEINLSAFPIDAYFSYNTTGSTPIVNGCSQSITVRQCVQQIFSTGPNNWRLQGVTGVRFFFTMAGGFYSTPFDGAGNVTSAWSSNLYWLFYDLKSFGVQNVTPTPVFDAWTGPDYLRQQRTVQTCTNSDGSGGFPKALNFYPWLPYGLDPTDSNFPERDCGPNSYSQAAQTPSDIFWGWDRFFNLMNTVMAQAHATGLGINGLDYYQESNMAFTVEARMIYDSGRSVDVLGQLRNAMSANGFDSGRVAPSANGPPTPNPANADCGSYYGDSALLINVSELAGAIAGPYSAIGDVPTDWPNGIPCYNNQAANMISVPVWHSQPTFVDSHSQKTYPDPNDLATFALNFYSDMWAFLQYRGLTGNLVIFGETNPVDNPGCDQWTYQEADAMVNGISGNNNGYKHSSLYANHASSVVMRPWHDGTYQNEQCTPSPNVINPPFDPFNP